MEHALNGKQEKRSNVEYVYIEEREDMSDISLLEEFLSIKYLGKYEWSPDGRFIAFIWDDGGINDLWLVAPGVSLPQKLTSAQKGVSDLAWLPKSSEMFFVMDDAIYKIGVSPISEPSLIYRATDQIAGISCSPEGNTLAFGLGGKIHLYDVSSCAVKQLEMPGLLSQASHLGIVLWSPGGTKFAFSFKDADTYHQIAVMGKDGDLIWKSHYEASSRDFSWFDDNSLYFAKHQEYGKEADLMLLGISNAHTIIKTIMHLKGSGKGPLLSTTSIPSPDGTKALFLLEDTGFAHYYMYDRGSGEVEQVTFGECEDFAHADDYAVWREDSSSFVYSSNRQSQGERRIYEHRLASGKDVEIIALPGTNSRVKFSSTGRMAFVHCDDYRNMDIWVCDSNGENPTQITFSMPKTLTEERQFVPEEVSFKSAGGLTIYGYLMKPRGIPQGTKVPGLVWVHGGPVRQMRPGWHPLQSYALFHGLNQYFVHRGYVVLSVNFRGGIGYGRDFRESLHCKMGVDDVADVVNAGRFLKTLPYVDPDRIAVWGLSYGGYMTLHALTQYPGEFRAGVNIAGIWDFAQYTKWAKKRYGKGMWFFEAFLEGEPEDSTDLYSQASPVTFADHLQDPLMSLHGTQDANVDFAQLDRIVKDCLQRRRHHEAIYYPDEKHVFRHRNTWLDAIPKIEEFLAKNI